MITIDKPETNRYWTHRPLLKAAVQATRGPVLELGLGDGSTPMLRELCAASGRPLMSVENNWSWYRTWSTKKTDLHRFAFVRDWAEAPLMPFSGQRWSVVFVDNAPGNRRRLDVARFHGAADIIVVHDTEVKHERLYRFSSDLWDRFKHVVHDERTLCRTTALSDVVDLTEWRF